LNRTYSTFAAAAALLLTACERPAASTPQPAPGSPPAAAPAATPSAATPAPAATPVAATPAATADSAVAPPPNASEQAAMEKFVREHSGQPEAAAGASGALPAGHPPIEGGAPAAASPAAALPSGHPAVPGVTTELKFEPPATWKPEQPRSPMRKAQFVLPRAEGDSEDGELVVFYFGPGEGGGVEDNLMRWHGMFKTAEGQPLPPETLQREQFEANGLKVTLMDTAGRYAPSAMPGMPATGPKDNYRMLAAVVETPGGPWFFRAVGPQATMTAQRDAFKQFLMTAKP
jgi:hypothetical protein